MDLSVVDQLLEGGGPEVGALGHVDLHPGAGAKASLIPKN